LILASLIAQSDRDNVRAVIGLQTGFFDAAPKEDLVVLGASLLRKFIERAAESISRATVVLARSRIELDQRRRALGCLLLLGSPRARSAAVHIARVAPTIGEPVLQRFGNRSARKCMERAKQDPHAALGFLGETIDRLCAIFGTGSGSWRSGEAACFRADGAGRGPSR
jgi:hypothetical protein